MKSKWLLFMYVGATKSKLYVHSLRGTSGILWVTEKDRDCADVIQGTEKAKRWAALTSMMGYGSVWRENLETESTVLDTQ